jgi:hypothetical protein
MLLQTDLTLCNIAFAASTRRGEGEKYFKRFAAEQSRFRSWTSLNAPKRLRMSAIIPKEDPRSAGTLNH